MTPDQKSPRPFTVIVADDLEPSSGYAFDQAVRIVERVPGSHLHVVHVIDPSKANPPDPDLAGRLRLYVKAKVASDGAPKRAVGVHVRQGKPAREIAQLATDVGADLIVLGTRKGMHLRQIFLGSVAERLLRAAPCAVFVAGPKPSPIEAHEPAIEPPCPACAAARQASGGQKWWCERHSAPHAMPHHYSFQEELPFGTTDAEVQMIGTPPR